MSESLITRTKKNYKELFWDTTDPNFYLTKQFFIDHKNYIIEHSEKHTFDNNDIYFQQFRLTEYLEDNGYDPSITWIVLMINNLGSVIDFKNLEFIYIPPMRFIRELYLDYKTYIRKYSPT